MFKSMDIVEKEDGEMVLVLNNKISASMKDNMYNATVAFSNSSIIAASCDCVAGGGCNANERVVCVHILPLIYQLTLLLDDGLAEHLLIELSSRWNPDLENCIKEQGKVEEMRENTISLMQHYGASDEMIEKSLKLTLAEVMKLYSTGTESVKKIPPPPRTKDLRPLRYLDLCSTVRKVKKRRSSSISNKSNEVIDSIMMEPMETLSDNSNNNNQTTILKINKDTNTLIPLPCDFCTSGITTTHVCRHPCGDRRIENENKNICGLAFCILCCGEEGNRTRCKHHVQSSTSSSSQTSSQTSSSTKAATSTQAATSKTSTVNENADYYDIYTAIRVLDFDIARCQFVGFNLLQERVKEILKEKSEKKITSYIEYQK